jgi:hypothetical protein
MMDGVWLNGVRMKTWIPGCIVDTWIDHVILEVCRLEYECGRHDSTVGSRGCWYFTLVYFYMSVLIFKAKVRSFIMAS